MQARKEEHLERATDPKIQVESEGSVSLCQLPHTYVALRAFPEEQCRRHVAPCMDGWTEHSVLLRQHNQVVCLPKAANR